MNEMMGQIINALSGEKDRRRMGQGGAQQFAGFDYERYNSHNISAQPPVESNIPSRKNTLDLFSIPPAEHVDQQQRAQADEP